MPSRGNGWQTPFSTAGCRHTLDVRRALDSPVHRPDRGKQKRLRVSSVRNAEETWLHRDRTESVCSSACRTNQAARSHRDRGAEVDAIQAGRWRRVGLLGPRQNLPPLDKDSDSGAM
jgi:hypothetical protein